MNLPPRRCSRSSRAFTLLEVMMVVAVIGVLVLLVGPGMREFIEMQRLRSVTSALVTDINFARSEAISRNQFLAFQTRNVNSEQLTCYTLFASSVNPQLFNALDPTACNCANGVGAACTGTQREVRTVQVERNSSLQLRTAALQPNWYAYDPISGAAKLPINPTLVAPSDEFCIEVTRIPRGRLRVGITQGGRPSVCTPDASVPGVDLCAPFNNVTRNCQDIPAP